MSSIVVAGDTSGSVTLSAPAVAGSTVLTLPSVSGTVTTNTTLAGADANIHGLTVGLGAGSVTSNTAFGVGALSSNTSGVNNTAVGSASLQYNTTGGYNVALGGSTLGQGVGSATTFSSCVAVGYGSLANNTGSNNTAIGYLSLLANTTASNNTAVGFQAGYSNTTGGVVAFGYGAGYANTTGTGTCAFGISAVSSNTTGVSNAGFGSTALLSATGSYNTAMGSGSPGIYGALQQLTTGSGNSAYGCQAGYNLTTGANNTIIGSQATTLTTGSNSVYIGILSNASAAGASQEIAIGYGGVGKGTNTGFICPNGGPVYQGNNSAAWSITSDQRLKKNIVDNNIGLSAINAIQVRNFEYRTAEEVTELEAHSAINIKGVQLGAIAQELQLILPECVKTESTGVMSVDATNLTWYLINAVKELSAKVTALESKLGAV